MSVYAVRGRRCTGSLVLRRRGTALAKVCVRALPPAVMHVVYCRQKYFSLLPYGSYYSSSLMWALFLAFWVLRRKNAVLCSRWLGERKMKWCSLHSLTSLEEVRFRRASQAGAVRPLKAFGQAISAFFEKDFGLVGGWCFGIWGFLSRESNEGASSVDIKVFGAVARAVVVRHILCFWSMICFCRVLGNLQSQLSDDGVV